MEFGVKGISGILNPSTHPASMHFPKVSLTGHLLASLIKTLAH
jgi:hypothetical protein